jgi:hypothetical protein
VTAATVNDARIVEATRPHRPSVRWTGPRASSIAKLALLESLPQDRYSRLRAAAPAMVECGSSEDYYGSAIDIFVAGVMVDARALTA